jgi:hypothetical protein
MKRRAQRRQMEKFMENTPPRVTVKEACKIIGGNQPIHPTTYYRGAKAGIYPRPDRVGPNIARVDTSKLMAAIAARTKSET